MDDTTHKDTMPKTPGHVPIALWYIYIVRTVDNFLYTGITTDVARRVAEHKERTKKSARFFKAHPARKLVFSCVVGSKSLALKVEYRFKRLAKTHKEKIVRSRKLSFCPETGKIES